MCTSQARVVSVFTRRAFVRPTHVHLHVEPQSSASAHRCTKCVHSHRSRSDSFLHSLHASPSNRPLDIEDGRPWTVARPIARNPPACAAPSLPCHRPIARPGLGVTSFSRYYGDHRTTSAVALAFTHVLLSPHTHAPTPPPLTADSNPATHPPTPVSHDLHPNVKHSDGDRTNAALDATRTGSRRGRGRGRGHSTLTTRTVSFDIRDRSA